MLAINSLTGEYFGIVEGKYTSLNPENYVVEQFTGLLDKNGREIYEGDVVKCRAVLDDNKIFNKAVEWSNGGFIANGALGVNHNLVEVIGNIHENPELLNP